MSDFVARLRAVAEPLYRMCECGSEELRWGANVELVRVNAMPPMKATHPTLRAIDAADRAFPNTFTRVWKRMHRNMMSSMKRALDAQFYGEWS